MRAHRLHQSHVTKVPMMPHTTRTTTTTEPALRDPVRYQVPKKHRASTVAVRSAAGSRNQEFSLELVILSIEPSPLSCHLTSESTDLPTRSDPRRRAHQIASPIAAYAHPTSRHRWHLMSELSGRAQTTRATNVGMRSEYRCLTTTSAPTTVREPAARATRQQV